ncbi:hypothetical protein L1887_47809 [Cichorium endivia]|nr:hypothetical protein L1887_47809 [Cichorium endivia]
MNAVQRRAEADATEWVVMRIEGKLGEWDMGARSLSADTRKDAGDEAIKDERKQQRSDEEGWRPMKVERNLVGSDLRSDHGASADEMHACQTRRGAQKQTISQSKAERNHGWGESGWRMVFSSSLSGSLSAGFDGKVKSTLGKTQSMDPGNGVLLGMAANAGTYDHKPQELHGSPVLGSDSSIYETRNAQAARTWS